MEALTEVDHWQRAHAAVREGEQNRGPGLQPDSRDLRPARVDADPDDGAAELD